jgi:predicted methyltransferase
MGDLGQGGPARGGNLEGEVSEVAEDTITISVDSGSQTVYIDEDTVVAYVEGAGELVAGSSVRIQADPTTDGVTTATLVVVLR